MSKKRKKVDQGKILLVSAILVGAPRWAGAMLAADVGEIDGELISVVLSDRTWLFVWSVGVTMAPVAILAGVGFAQKGLVSIGGEDEKVKTAKSATQSATQKTYHCGECAYTSDKSQGIAAHYKNHPSHNPAINTAVRASTGGNGSGGGVRLEKGGG
jgi:hypothetical protein